MTNDDRDPRIQALLEQHTPPQPPGTAWQAIATPRPRWHRAARIGFATAGFASIVALIFALFLAAPNEDPASSSPRFADRSEGGVAMVLRAKPLRGSRLTKLEAADSAARVLKTRAERKGYRILAAPRGDGTLDVWVPIARTSNEVALLLMPAAVAIYDLRAGVVAEGRNADAVFDRVEREGPKGPGTQYYLVNEGRVALGPAEDEETLIRLQGASDAPESRSIRYVPAGFTLIVRLGSNLIRVVADDPAVPFDDISSIQQVQKGSRSVAISTDVNVPDRAGRRLGVVVVSEFVPTALYGQVDGRESGPRRLVALTPRPQFASGLEALVGPGVLPVILEVQAEQATGPSRAPRGARVSELPPSLGQILALDVPNGYGSVGRDSLRRSLTLTTGEGDWSLWSGEKGFYAIVDPTSLLGGPTVGTSGIGEGACELSPGRPTIDVCGGGSNYLFGRVADGVVEIAGARATKVENGWFLAVGSDGQAGKKNPRWRITAYDRNGLVAGRATGFAD